MKIFKYLFLFLTGCLITFSSIGQEYRISVESFSVEDGLMARYSKVIFQDSTGYIWNVNFPDYTSDAFLDRFDGKEIKHFNLKINRPEWDEPELLRVYQAFDNKFWVYRAFNANVFKSELDERERNSVFYAIHVFDPQSDSTVTLSEYLNYPLPFESTATSTLMVGHNNEMLVGTTTGAIYELSQEGYTLKFQEENKASISQIIPVDDGYWVGLSDRFIKLNRSWAIVDSFLSKTAMAVNTEKGGRYNNIRQPAISSLQDHKGYLHHIAFDTSHRELSKTPRRNHYINGVLQKASSDLDFFAISPDRHILFAIRRSEVKNQSIVAMDLDGNVLVEQPTAVGFVEDSYFDKDQNLWLATNDGMVLIRFEKQLFRKYLYDLSAYSYRPFQARGMAQTSDSILWIGGIGKLQRLNLKTGTSRANDELILTRDIQLIDEQLYISEEYSKIFQFNPKTQQYNTLDYSAEEYATGRQPRQHWKFHKDKFGNIWAASFKGLTLIEPETKVLNHLPNTGTRQALEGADIIDIYENDKGMWLATTKGLYLFDPETKNIVDHFHTEAPVGHQLPHNSIAHIYEDSDGVFWLASRGGGLIKWQPENGKFEQFTTKDGLSHDVIYAVYEDHDQNLWLPSSQGINQFHKTKHNTSYYLKADGLTHDEFNTISHFRGHDSTLYFGGLNGINAFHPKDFSASLESDHTALVITGLSKQDKATGQLKDEHAAFEQTQQVTLYPSEVGFNLSFRLLDYRLSKEALYAYKIEGLDADWNYQSISNLRINRLPYGNYSFQLKATSGRGLWTAPIQFEINVLRPFYLQPWFMLLCIALIISLVYLLVYLRNRRLRESERQLKKEVALRTEEIEKQSLELKKLDKAKSQFFANISHELRTPLTLILSPLQELIQEGSFDKNQLKQLERMHRNGHNLSVLVEEILELSRLEAGKLEVRETEVEIKPLFRRIFAAYESMASRKGIEYSCQLHFSDQALLYLDEGKIEKVINNLISNAIKFTNAGGSVKLSAFLEYDHFRILVEDSGKGIASKDLPKIFDRFFQGELREFSQLQGGTGIGLALAKELTEVMGGKITVESNLNEGTAFQLILPRKEVSEPTKPVAKPVTELVAETSVPEEPVLNTANNAEFRLLLVEDNADMRNYITEILVSEYDIVQAENGKAALEQLKLSAFDLVISDVMMPEMDGFTLLRMLKSNDLYRHLPVIMLTARAEGADKLNALTIGVDDYLTKPFIANELRARVKNLLANYKSRISQKEKISGDSLMSAMHQTIDSAEALSWIKKVENEALTRLNDFDFSMEIVAEALNITERQLQRKVKQITGLTPNKYVQELRLQLGRSYLEKGTHHTLNEVTLAVGFKSSRYFSKLYRERFGRSATDHFKTSGSLE